MNRVRSIVVLVAFAVLVSAPSATAAEGAAITAVGWWTSVPVTSAPEGGIAVGNGGSGPIAVAALRFSVDEEPPTSAKLTLTEADGVGADAAALSVCPTPNEWEPVAAGPMADAPRPECSRGSVELERAADGTWTGDVASLLEPGQPSLMVIPSEPEAEGAPTSPFQLSFDPPALTATPAPASLEDDAVTPTRPAAQPAPVAPASTPTFTPPPPPSATNPPTTTTSIAEPVTDEVAIGPAVTIPTSTASSVVEDRPWGQMVFFLVISGIAGVAAGVGRHQLRLRRA